MHVCMYILLLNELFSLSLTGQLIVPNMVQLIWNWVLKGRYFNSLKAKQISNEKKTQGLKYVQVLLYEIWKGTKATV